MGFLLQEIVRDSWAGVIRDSGETRDCEPMIA